MALFNSESFRSYDVVVLDGIDYGNFKPGIFGLSLAQIRNIKGAGASAIVKLAGMFGIAEDVELLKYSIDDQFQVKYVISPAFRNGKDENEQTHLYFTTGDWKLPLLDVFQVAGDKIIPEILEVKVGEDKREYACFSFDFNVAGQVKKDGNKLSFSIATNRDVEKASEEIVKIFATSADMSELYSRLVSSPAVGAIGEGANFAQLKELPYGGYEVSQIEWEDRTITAKKGDRAGQQIKIQNWRFKAVNVETKESYIVNASKGSFFGKAITNNGDQDSSILALAAKGKPGSIILTHESDDVMSNGGVRPIGRVFANLEAGKAYLNVRLPQIALAAQLKSAQPAAMQAPAINPSKSASPLAATLNVQATPVTAQQTLPVDAVPVAEEKVPVGVGVGTAEPDPNDVPF